MQVILDKDNVSLDHFSFTGILHLNIITARSPCFLVAEALSTEKWRFSWFDHEKQSARGRWILRMRRIDPAHLVTPQLG